MCSSAMMTEEGWVIAVMFVIFPDDILVKSILGCSDGWSQLLPGLTKADASKAMMVP